MSTKLTHRLALVIPKQRKGCAELERLIVAATRCAGGVTITEQRGVWFDGLGHEHSENVERHEWWFTKAKYSDMMAATAHIINRLHTLGEECVMGDKYTPDLGLRAHLIYP